MKVEAIYCLLQKPQLYTKENKFLQLCNMGKSNMGIPEVCYFERQENKGQYYFAISQA